MKIEKINDNQIRCTLNKADLASRHLKISELAYGTEKAKMLFRDMMQQASNEFGFEAEDIPLMIEAIPVSPDCIILIITKVEDPDELDTRFSKFSMHSSDDEDDDSDDDFDDDDDSTSNTVDNTSSTSSAPAGVDDILNVFSKLRQYLKNSSISENPEQKKDSFIPFKDSLKNAMDKNAADNSMEQAMSDNMDNMEVIEGKDDAPKDKQQEYEINMVKVYSFTNLMEVNRVAKVLDKIYSGYNSLYKDTKNECYYLQISNSDSNPEVYNRVCNILCEFGASENGNYARLAFFNEHFSPVILENAIHTLATL